MKAPRTQIGGSCGDPAHCRACCFISLGVTFHAGAENMISTIMPAMVRDIGGVELNGWTFAIYEIGSIIAGAATGRLTTYWSVRANLIVAALIFTLGTIETALSPTMYWALIGRLISGFGGGALISLSFVAVQRYFPRRYGRSSWRFSPLSGASAPLAVRSMAASCKPCCPGAGPF